MAVAAQTLTPEQELQQIVRRIIEAYAPDKIILSMGENGSLLPADWYEIGERDFAAAKVPLSDD